MLPEDIHIKIKKRRLALKLNQEQLAERADISIPFLSNVENGQRNISLTTFY